MLPAVGCRKTFGFSDKKRCPCLTECNTNPFYSVPADPERRLRPLKGVSPSAGRRLAPNRPVRCKIFDLFGRRFLGQAKFQDAGGLTPAKE